jgi:hypothetical protein
MLYRVGTIAEKGRSRFGSGKGQSEAEVDPHQKLIQLWLSAQYLNWLRVVSVPRFGRSSNL